MSHTPLDDDDDFMRAVAGLRAAASRGPLRDWDEVAAELGIDLAGLPDAD